MIIYLNRINNIILIVIILRMTRKVCFLSSPGLDSDAIWITKNPANTGFRCAYSLSGNTVSRCLNISVMDAFDQLSGIIGLGAALSIPE